MPAVTSAVVGGVAAAGSAVGGAVAATGAAIGGLGAGGAALAGGAISAGVGAYTASKTRKANEKAAKKAELSEKNRRQRAAQELEKATTRYNEIRAERPGFTVQQFLEEQATALGGEEGRALQDQIRSMKAEDVQAAQAVADEATTGNINTFDIALDAVSGGDSARVLAKRNDLALNEDSQAQFDRALQLRSTAIPAGTVRQDSEGRFVEGQRADKQTFQIAADVDQASRDRQFGKLNSILESDRSIAERQQSKALDFLSQQNTSDVLSGLTAAGSDRRDRFQAVDEQVQLENIRQFQAAAFTDQTRQITPATDNSAALISGGFDTALKGIGLFSNKSS